MAEPLSLSDQIIVALRRITRAIDLYSRVLMQDYGLTAPQLSTLRIIEKHQSVTAGQIAREVHLSQPTMTGILNRLETRGLIARVRSERDRRSVHVSLTDQGRHLIASAPSLLRDHFQNELAKLQDWERTLILATLQRIADMMNAEQESETVLFLGLDPTLSAAAETAPNGADEESVMEE